MFNRLITLLFIQMPTYLIKLCAGFAFSASRYKEWLLQALMTNKSNNHCRKCNSVLKKSDKGAYTNYQCSVCNRFVSTKTRVCKNHPTAEISAIQISATDINYKCENCGLAPKKKQKSPMVKVVDRLQRSIVFDRKFMKILSSSPNGQNSKNVMNALVNHINKYNPKKVIDSLTEAWIPHELLTEILEDTECDKWVEKSKLENIILWTMSLFLEGKHASLPLTAISDASNSSLGRKLTDEKPIDHNTLGVRLENPNLVLGLEKIFQLCSAQLGSDAFNDETNLIPVYYDWFYFVKGGNTWENAKKVGRGDDSKGIKVGIGVDWESNSIVSLIVHGEEHPNDAVSFREHLMITNRPGIIHISDKGPSSVDTMEEILDNDQHFIIPMKKNTKFKRKYQINVGTREFTLRTPSNPTVTILEESIITLNANPELGDLKYIKFKYNNSSTGKFETMELLSSLPMGAAEIIEMAAWRWRSTETEFRIFQHELGLEKVFLQKPEKIWPMLLIVLSCKMLLELTFRGIHMLHGGKMMISSFKRGFGKFLNAIINGKDPWIMIEPCNSPVCPYRRKHGQRLK